MYITILCPEGCNITQGYNIFETAFPVLCISKLQSRFVIIRLSFPFFRALALFIFHVLTMAQR